MFDNKEKLNPHKIWVTVEKPGYLGKRKDEREAEWNQQYGEGKWRYAWELADGKTLDFEEVFWQVYVAGYAAYFAHHPNEAIFLTDQYAYAYDKEMVTREQAFDPFYLYNQPGHPNQFHNVALNIAMEWFLGLPFSGEHPVQVREGKPGTPVDQQPEGYLWSPGRIPAVRLDLIPPRHTAGWWNTNSIESFYQNAKVVQVKASFQKVKLPNLSRSPIP